MFIINYNTTLPLCVGNKTKQFLRKMWLPSVAISCHLFMQEGIHSSVAPSVCFAEHTEQNINKFISTLSIHSSWSWHKYCMEKKEKKESIIKYYSIMSRSPADVWHNWKIDTKLLISKHVRMYVHLYLPKLPHLSNFMQWIKSEHAFR